MTFRRTDQDMPPLPDDVVELLARGGAHPVEPDPGVRARLRARLLELGPAGAGSKGAPQAAAAGRTLLAKPIALALATYAVGIASGVVLHARLRAGVAPAVSPATSQPTPAACVAPAPPVPAPGAPPASCPPLDPSPAALDRQEALDRGLGRERALLEQARAALVSGDSAAALAALDRHRRGFPDGRLAEERDVLRVKALLAGGRAPEARAAAGRFLRKHPSSLFRPAVERALGDPAATE